MSALASGGAAWGGVTAGIVAVVVFLAFSTWIVLERVRAGRRHRDD